MSINIHTRLHRIIPSRTPPIDALQGRMVRRGGWCPPTHTRALRQIYRVADNSLSRYELYVGEDVMPDFGGVGQPVATETSLPVSWTPTPPGAGTLKLYAVTRKRNKYNLLSHNQHPTIVEIDDTGDEVLGPLTAPEILRVLDRESGELIVQARYPRGIDRNEADTWELYVEAGIDPDPDLDSPVATADFAQPGADWMWKIIEDSLTPGTTYHVMVVVKRDGDGSGERGESAVTEHVAAETYDIDAGDASLFGGREYEIGL